ncbi:MAG: PKD domain-containing protein, partial [Flavobacteriales bacterium]
DLAVTMSWNQGSTNTVLFTGTANFAPDGYLWDFGDGEQGYDQSVTHTYDPGTYTACFSAYLWNEQAQDTCWAQTCQTVTITGGDPCDQLNAGFQVTTDGPVATFHSSNSTAQYYEWHFGDGSIGYGPMPTHTYTGTGTYTTCLLVSAWDPQTQDSCFADHCETVVILTTGIAEGSNLDEVKTWPQPFSRALTLSGDALNGSYRVTLLDMAGRIADDRQLTINGTAQLDYRTIPPGSYILRLQGDTAVRSVRVLKY